MNYKGMQLDCAYRMDIVVENAVILEIKAMDAILPIHKAQLLTYLKSSGKQVGFFINFNVPVLKNGIKRMVNRYPDSPSSQRNLSALGVSAVNPKAAVK